MSDGASIENYNISILNIFGIGKSAIEQNGLDPCAIGVIHLASEYLDIEFHGIELQIKRLKGFKITIYFLLRCNKIEKGVVFCVQMIICAITENKKKKIKKTTKMNNELQCPVPKMVMEQFGLNEGYSHLGRVSIEDIRKQYVSNISFDGLDHGDLMFDGVDYQPFYAENSKGAILLLYYRAKWMGGETRPRIEVLASGPVKFIRGMLSN